MIWCGGAERESVEERCFLRGRETAIALRIDREGN
jgi:hypothetical protein